MDATTHGFTQDPANPLRWHRDGKPSELAPRPPRRHRCVTQTMELDLDAMAWIHWCACGSVRDGKRWLGKNSRRHDGE